MSAGVKFRLTDLYDAITSSSNGSTFAADTEALLEELRSERGVVGAREAFEGPYGTRRLTYCDYTASGRAVGWIEDFVRDRVLPLYGNSHTTQSVTGHQSTLYLHEARLLLKRLVNANFSKGPDKDLLLFYGSGSTACVNALVDSLDLSDAVVFVSTYEHHSNLIPWRESAAQVVEVPGDEHGAVSLTALESLLRQYANRKVRIGSFSAASNVTGQLSDVSAICKLLHAHGALSFWDYATAAPYVPINMNREPHKQDYMDAIFLSPHKMLGGVATPGMLVVKKHLFSHQTPVQPGGGTVFFVTPESHVYLKRREEREEGGTPNIVGAIRCALAFQLKAALGDAWIGAREEQLRAMAVERWSKHPAIRLLGAQRPNTQYLPIISLVMVHPAGRMLHYNLVCALLNDLFGVQCRGGCMCAGPFGEHLLGMDPKLAARYQEALEEHDDNEILRPGFVRLNLHYTMTDEEAQFVIDAVEFVATHGYKLMSFYKFEHDTGEWYHPKMKKFPDRRWLEDLTYAEGHPRYPEPREDLPPQDDFRTYLERAQRVVEKAERKTRQSTVPVPQVALRDEAEPLRWFVLPWEQEVDEGLWALQKSPLALNAGVPQAVAQQAQAQESKEREEEAPMCVTEYRPVLPADQLPSHSMEGVRWHFPSRKTILKKVQQALDTFNMIEAGDRILVCLSGGKDSLTLLHVMKQLQHQFKKFKPFEFGAVTVDPMSVGFDPRPLIPYLKALGVPYFYEQQPVIDIAKEKDASSICSWCARMKRGIIYKTARREGYNVLAMGQHLDDCCESFMMSVFLNGRLRTMKAHYTVDKGDLRVIRPLIHVREHHLKQFAAEKKLPVISENCPACFAEPQERERMKTLLENTSLVVPGLYQSMARAMMPLHQQDIVSDTRAERRAERAARFKPGRNTAGRKKGALAPTFSWAQLAPHATLLACGVLIGLCMK